MTTPLIGLDYGGASAAIVHQDRLVLAGSGAISDLLVASRTGQWQDFRLGLWRWAVTPQGVNVETGTDGAIEQAVVAPDPLLRTGLDADGQLTNVPEVASFDATPADGFFVAQASGRGNRFHALLQQEGLFVLGDTGESVVPAGAFTSDEVEVRENSWFGSDVGRLPVIAGGLVIFVQSGGDDIRGIAWTEAQRKYIAVSMLTVAGDVFGRAVDMTFQRSTGRQGDTVYVVGEDGDVGVMLLSVGAPHPAWSTWTTPGGRVVAAAAPLGIGAWLVERDGEIGLETAVDDAPCADGIVPKPGDTIPGGTHYVKREGRWVAIDEDAEMPLGAGEEVGWIGRPWDAEAETLPYIASKRTGIQRSVRKVRILDISLDLVIPRDTPLVTGPDASERIINRAAALLNDVTQARVSAVTERGTSRRKQKRFKAKTTKDTDRIVRMRYGNTQGWKDRVALRIQLSVRLGVAGLSFRAIA